VIQLANIQGQVLDYDGKEFTMTRQAMSFLDMKMTGDSSVNFKVNNSPYNRKVLGYYGAMQVDRPVRIPFNILENGNVIKSGQISIKSSGKDIDCFFLSGNANWFQDLEFNCKGISFPDSFTVLSSDVDGRKAATEGIIFPLIDWWSKDERRATNYLSMTRAVYPGDDNALTDIHPCI